MLKQTIHQVLEDEDNKVESEDEGEYFDSSMTGEIKSADNSIANKANDAINMIDNLMSQFNEESQDIYDNEILRRGTVKDVMSSEEM